ncbi:MAG: sulfotransferase domain-containing protein [Bacteroidota bacterium]|nr:sulfotransferase domain-containing protein [Bacteroidota bacterium]
MFSFFKRTEKAMPLSIEKGDWFLASYPRSGNTWIRIMLANLFFKFPEINSLVKLQEFVPDVHFGKPFIQRKIEKKFKLIKTHEPFGSKMSKAIYIYRNPLDSAWSFYNFLKDIKALKSADTDLFIADFFKGTIPYGRWDTHVLGWENAALKNSNIVSFSYEEINRDPILFLSKVTTLLKVSSTEHDIDRAVKESTAALVKKITNDEVFYGTNIPQFVTTPIYGESIEKKAFKEKYIDLFKSEIKIYDFEKNELRK